jgi:hypothetical protein
MSLAVANWLPPLGERQSLATRALGAQVPYGCLHSLEGGIHRTLVLSVPGFDHLVTQWRFIVAVSVAKAVNWFQVRDWVTAPSTVKVH